jgi:hypothetical protein
VNDPEKSTAWYRDFHFGDAIMQPLLARYAHAGDADDYVLYRRRPASPALPTAPASP